MSEPAAKRRDALREGLEEAIGRDLAAGVTRTALRLASATEPPTEEAALRLYLEGPLATAVAEALGRDAASALVHILRARLFAPETLPPPPRTVSADMPKQNPAVVATTSAIRRSEQRFVVALRCADALRRSEMARSLVQAQCDVTIVSGLDDVARLRDGKRGLDLAVIELDGVEGASEARRAEGFATRGSDAHSSDVERIVRELSDSFHAPVIALADASDAHVVRALRAAGVHRFAILPKSASSRELLESVTELLVGFVRSK